MNLKLNIQEIKGRAKKRLVNISLALTPLSLIAIFVIIFAQSQLYRLVGVGALSFAIFLFAYSAIGLKRIVKAEIASLADRDIEEMLSQKIIDEDRGTSQMELKKVEDILSKENNWVNVYPLPQVDKESTYSVGLGIKNIGKSKIGRNEVALRVSVGSSILREQKSQWGCFMSFKATMQDQITIEIFSPRKIATEYALSVSLEKAL